MCTVSFIARKNGYILGMNRDEKLTRVEALAPRRVFINGRAVICPSEPTGGTWIAVNDAGNTFALINWYSVQAKVSGDAVTRGIVVKAVAAQASPDRAHEILKRLPLKRINPFRLIGFFPAQKEIHEWRWNLKHLSSLIHQWDKATWISSGFDEPGAQLARGRIFETACRQRSVGTLRWLRRLHRSHGQEPGPYSTCMHRADAATVSYTEVVVNAMKVTMGYHAGPICLGDEYGQRHLKLINAKVNRDEAYFKSSAIVSH